MLSDAWRSRRAVNGSGCDDCRAHILIGNVVKQVQGPGEFAPIQVQNLPVEKIQRRDQGPVEIQGR